MKIGFAPIPITAKFEPNGIFQILFNLLFLHQEIGDSEGNAICAVEPKSLCYIFLQKGQLPPGNSGVCLISIVCSS
jgi:hypothetical protein